MSGIPRSAFALAASTAGLALVAATVLTAVPAAAAEPADRSLQRQFSSAAAEFHVPEGLLLALSYQQTRWDSHDGAPSTTGNYNVMGLTQVDVSAVRAALAAGPGPDTVDGRGDDLPARPVRGGVPAQTVQDGPELHTLDAAAKLLGRPAADLRSDPAQSVRGGAALLAQYQRESGPSGSADPTDWYAAVARFGDPTADRSGSPSGSPFADRVFGTLRTGADRRTAEGQTVHLAAAPNAVPKPAPRSAAKSGAQSAARSTAESGTRAGTQAAAPARSAAAADGSTECPVELGCDFRPAAYALTDPKDPGSYGNYTQANRPDDGQQIQYIVIHDTEGGFEGSISTFQNPSSQASAHYIVRSSDGHVTQLVNNRHVAWHAGNKTVNMHSIGIEHEGYAFPSDRPTWYSEQLYQSSATLVRYLAGRYGIPLDREHVIGHDDVPGPVQANVAGMHWDPGTFWDWSHYMDLLGAPLRTAPTGGQPAVGSKVTIAPAFDSTNQPPVNGTADRPENFVYLRTQPDPNAPLLNGGSQNAADWKDKAVAGAGYVVADVSGEWTAIWYDGQRAWFYNPSGRSAVQDTRPGRTLLTPRAGLSSIPVYGRSYPESTAYLPYPAITAQPVSPLSASIPAGQSYVALSAAPVRSDYYYAMNIDGSAPNDRTLVVGCDTYFPIRYNHRLAYLKSSDVDGGAAAPGCTRPPVPSAGVLRGAGSGRCLDVPGNSRTDGTGLDIWDCNGGDNQQWTLTADGRITTYGGTKCLDAYNNQTANGTKVEIATCNGGANQQWRLNADGTVTGVQSGRCLDVSGAYTANGTPVDLWDCNGGTNQKWARTGVLRGAGSGRCLDVPGNSRTDGTGLDIWDCNGGDNQQWTLTADGRITTYGGTKCLDAYNNQTANGTKVEIATCNGGANQQWRLNADGTVTGVQSGRCLDVSGAYTANGTPVDLWDCNGGTNQKWNLV
ncbi:ricin-type beta-trefoil lectin domain protein [Kitasatospora sp. NPDC088391]|uniref:ricin-type beta-trefoil lectin domain protein n=1 Tax=Kitasatospora sp. NPDC088391 TaxID=3364074 RepID=UPI003814C278